jgi:hypothetical protein
VACGLCSIYFLLDVFVHLFREVIFCMVLRKFYCVCGKWPTITAIICLQKYLTNKMMWHVGSVVFIFFLMFIYSGRLFLHGSKKVMFSFFPFYRAGSWRQKGQLPACWNFWWSF